jgi:hypothetical protein
MQLDIRYPIVFLSTLIIIVGIYFKFLYDVPDGQEVTNGHVSFILVVIGIIGIMLSSILKKKTPMKFDSDFDEYTNSDNDGFNTNSSTPNRNIKHTKRKMEES